MNEEILDLETQKIFNSAIEQILSKVEESVCSLKEGLCQLEQRGIKECTVSFKFLEHEPLYQAMNILNTIAIKKKYYAMAWVFKDLQEYNPDYKLWDIIKKEKLSLDAMICKNDRYRYVVFEIAKFLKVKT